VAQAAAAALDKGHIPRERREKLLREVNDGDALATINAMFGALPIAQRLRRIEERLDLASERALADGAHQHLSGLGNSQLRALETGAKVAGLPAFVPRASDGAGSGREGSKKFSIQIILGPGPGQTVSINATPQDLAENEIEGEVADTTNGDTT
jgi:hypothetical protein